MFDKYKINAMIYHYPCSDGFGAATCLYKFAKDNNIQDIDYIPDSYGNKNIDGILERIKGKYLVICDFSYSESIINKIKEITENFIIIDHHKTAEKELINLEDKHKIFDMNRSGAKLMWDFLFNDPTDSTPKGPQSLSPSLPKGPSNLPELIKYIQDRDLWQNKMPNIKEFVSWFYNLPFDFNIYYEYLMDDKKFLDNIVIKGTSYQEITDIYISQQVNCDPVFCMIDNKYYFVAYCNSPYFVSDIGNRLILKYNLVDFSAVYSIKTDCITKGYSLRSDNDFADTSRIAKLSGGGGHRNASGLISTLDQVFLPSSNNNICGLYNIIENAWFDFNKLNIIYIDYNDNYEQLHTYLLDSRETVNNNYLQQAQYIFNKLTGVNHLGSLIFDACVSVIKNNNTTEFIVSFYDITNDRVSNLKNNLVNNRLIVNKVEQFIPDNLL